MNRTNVSVTGFNLNNEVSRVSTFINPATITFSLITNILNICVLSRRTLRSSSCTHYFLALAPANVIYMCSSPLTVFLINRFGTALPYTPFGCRISFFNIYGSALFVTLMLICASIDRFLSSSSSVRLRQMSQVRVARRVVILITIATVMYSSPFIVISYWDDSLDRCLQASSTLISLYLSSRIVLYYIIGPLAMTIFGFLTIYNIRNQTVRVAPVIHNFARQNSRRRTEGQLARMLIIQVGAYVLFSFPSAVTYTLTTFIPSMNTPFINALRTITLIWQQGSYLMTFFLYILSAKIYREELRRLFQLNYFCQRGAREATQRVLAQFAFTHQTETRL